MKVSEKTYYPIFEKWLKNRGYTSHIVLFSSGYAKK